MALHLFRTASHVCIAGFTTVLLGFSAEQASAQTPASQLEAVRLPSVHELQQLIDSDRATALGTALEINCKKAGELGIPFEFCGGTGEGEKLPEQPRLAPLRNQPSLNLTPDGIGIRITFPLR